MEETEGLLTGFRLKDFSFKIPNKVFLPEMKEPNWGVQQFSWTMQVEKAKNHTCKKKKLAHIVTNPQASNVCSALRVLNMRRHVPPSQSVWPIGIIKIHYLAMRCQLIPNDLGEWGEGLNSEKLSQELIDV